MSKGPQNPGSAGASSRVGVSYFPNDNLAEAIVRAWSDPSYRKDLLTFGDDNAANWEAYPNQRKSMLRKTSLALEEVGVFLNNAVVLTPGTQYDTYVKQDEEIVFVLPSQPGRTPSLATARVEMAIHIDGI